MIKQDNFRPLANRLVIAQALALARDRAAIHAYPQAIRATSSRYLVVQVPNFQPTGIAPLNPLSIDPITPIGRARQIVAGKCAELARAVFAMADAAPAQPAPTVVGETFGVVTLGDFAQEIRQILPKVGPIDARHEEVT